MTRQVACACGKKFRAPESLAGKRVKCPACRGPIDIPPLETEDDPLGIGDLGGFESSANPLNISGTLPPVATEPVATSKSTSQPTKRGRGRKSKAKAGAEFQRAIGMIVGGIVMAAIGIGVSVVSYRAAKPGESYVAWTGLIFAGFISSGYGLMGLVRSWNYRSGKVSESGEAGVDHFVKNLGFVPVLLVGIVVVIGGMLVLIFTLD